MARRGTIVWFCRLLGLDRLLLTHSSCTYSDDSTLYQAVGGEIKYLLFRFSIRTISHTDCSRSVPGDDKNVTKVVEESKPAPSPSETTPAPLLPTKPPSKILGPLLVYTNNQEDPGSTKNDSVQRPSKVPHEENPYYHMGQEFHEVTNDDDNDFDYNEGPPPPPPPVAATKHKSKPQLSLGEIPKKSKPNAKGAKPGKPNPDLDYPYLVQEQRPKQPGQPSQVAVHGKGDADELLQFINQHPELTNYPSGSVFEIHNIPDHKPQYVNPATRPVVPFVYEPPGHPGLPPGLNVDQVLQQIHKQQQQHHHHPNQPFVPFPQNPNGLFGPNVTQPG